MPPRSDVRLLTGDAIEQLRTFAANSFDVIVTDPPYELGLLGLPWDSTGIACSVPLWQEALRVLKPGGHLLAFGAPRTYHRMATAIEAAGFEIRDSIQWIYGSGFPHGLNIARALDRERGDREAVLRPVRSYRDGALWRLRTYSSIPF